MRSSLRHTHYIFVEFKDGIVAGLLGGLAYVLLTEPILTRAFIASLSIAVGYLASNVMAYIPNSGAIMMYKSRYLFIAAFCVLAFIMLYGLMIKADIAVSHITLFYVTALASVFSTERFNLGRVVPDAFGTQKF